MRVSPFAQGVAAAVMTPLFLGMAPIFGKLAITAGADSFTVAALRTVIAVALLWAVYAVFFRRFIYIYPAGLLGCVVVGVVNGIGSLFYYGGLGLLDASRTQLLNGMYIVFALLLSRIGGEKPDKRVTLRVALALLALVMITGLSGKTLDWLGIGLMLASALMFAGTMILSQYVVYEMPSPTATLYILTTMAVLVVMVWAAIGSPPSTEVMQNAFTPILILGVTTAVSRLAMFASVQFLGSLRTAVVSISEIGVALMLAFVVLGERLAPPQVIGVAILFLSLLLIRARDVLPHVVNPNALLFRDMAGVQFQRIAFHRAFGRKEHDNEFGVMSTLTTAELEAIGRMMGVNGKPVDPFPLTPRHGIDLAAFLESQDITRPSRPTGDAGGDG